MSLHGFLFYLLAASIVVSTAVAVTRSHLVHAVVYLILSFFGTAMLFYLLGAPFLAALEIIVYAGAIMVLFLFVIMMLKSSAADPAPFAWLPAMPALLIALLYLMLGLLLAGAQRGESSVLMLRRADPASFGTYLFQHHWLAIEIISLILLVAAVGALVVGQVVGRKAICYPEEGP
jgi:NADH-quinone oxidoreductase subunit J